MAKEKGYYEDLTPSIKWSDRLAIYKVKGSKKGLWSMRIKKRTGGYQVRSLKTADKYSAMVKADEYYTHFHVAETKGVYFTDARFMDMFQKFLESGTLSAHRYKKCKSLYSRYYAPWFKNMPLDEINGTEFNKWLTWRCRYWLEYQNGNYSKLFLPKDKSLHGPPVHNKKIAPSVTTLKGERQVMIQFLRWCKANGHLNDVPILLTNTAFDKAARINAVDRRHRAKSLPDSPHRQSFTQIMRRIKTYSMIPEKNWIRKMGRMRLYYWIMFCKHCLIRPSTECQRLLWSDIEFMESKKNKLPIALIKVRFPKTGRIRKADDVRFCVMPHGQVKYITEWHAYLKSLGPKFGKLHHPVFPNYEGEYCEASRMGRLLSRKLGDWGLHRLESGQVITAYSLARHCGIQDRIVKNHWTIQRVAAMAGTSAFAISNSYLDSFIKQNPEPYADIFVHREPHLRPKELKHITDGMREIASYFDADDIEEEEEE